MTKQTTIVVTGALRVKGYQTFSGDEMLSNLVSLPSESKSILKGKTLLLNGIIYEPYYSICIRPYF